jgi:hypothetical protein
MALMKQIYSVWVDGGEVNDYYLDLNEAFELAQCYKDEGYGSVVVRREL